MLTAEPNRVYPGDWSGHPSAFLPIPYGICEGSGEKTRPAERVCHLFVTTSPASAADLKRQGLRVEKMRRKGRHHVRINLPCKQGSNFEDLCGAFLGIYPEERRWFEAVETVQIDAVRDLMGSIGAKSELQEPYRLSKKRQAHICAMLTMRKERIRNILDKDRFDD